MDPQAETGEAPGQAQGLPGPGTGGHQAGAGEQPLPVGQNHRTVQGVGEPEVVGGEDNGFFRPGCLHSVEVMCETHPKAFALKSSHSMLVKSPCSKGELEEQHEKLLLAGGTAFPGCAPLTCFFGTGWKACATKELLKKRVILLNYRGTAILCQAADASHPGKTLASIGSGKDLAPLPFPHPPGLSLSSQWRPSSRAYRERKF